VGGKTGRQIGVRATQGKENIYHLRLKKNSPTATRFLRKGLEKWAEERSKAGNWGKAKTRSERKKKKEYTSTYVKNRGSPLGVQAKKNLKKIHPGDPKIGGENNHM